MAVFDDQLLSDIERSLHSSWTTGERVRIHLEVNKIQGEDVKARAARTFKKKELEKESSERFSALWNANIKPQITAQREVFHKKIEQQLRNRHPWLNTEGLSTADRYSMKDLFLSATLKSVLFDLLVEKPPTADTWDKIKIHDDMKLKWKPIDENSLKDKIQGYPLSDAAFYDNRPLPSYLDSPFAQSPTRYDLYRLLKKSYGNKFKPAQLPDSSISCTKIAPLLHTELNTLSDQEWNYLETILVNVGTEEDPAWALLHKENGAWSLYIPQFLASKEKQINTPNGLNIKYVDHAYDSELPYSKINSWHAVLLSRVLPWSQLTQSSTLGSYRANIPVPLLFQNTLESTCLTAQQSYANKSHQAFAKRSPFSTFNEQEIYAHPDKQLTSLPLTIPETPANAVINALDANEISYDPNKSTLTVHRLEKLSEAMKMAYYHGIKQFSISVPSPKLPESLKQWFEYNLEITDVAIPSTADGEYLYACAARNRFLAKNDYLSQAQDKIKARQTAWENTGRLIYEFFKNPPNKLQSQNIAQMGSEGLDVFFKYLSQLQAAPCLSCTLDLDSGQTLESKDYIRLLSKKIESFTKKPLFSKLNLVLPKALNDSMDEFKKLLSVLNERNEIKEVNFENQIALTSELLDNLIKFVSDKNICLQIKIPKWDEKPCNETTDHEQLKAKYRALQNTILTNIRQTRQRELNANTAALATQPTIAYPLKSKKSTTDDELWESNKTYQLAGTTGVQQQAQQEIAQEVQQEAEQQSQPKAPIAREILEYTGDQQQLITRHNLTEQHVSKEDFSAWVGSTRDAQFVIQKMDQAAFNQIKAFPSLFKFGIDADRTPGFRLCYASSADKTLILTYDANLVEQDLADQSIDPFAIQMNQCKSAIPFDGDYRQFTALASADEQHEITLWNHLATEEVPEKIQAWLTENDCNTTTSESMQYHNVHQQIARADNQQAMQGIIKTWSGIDDDNFFKALFNNLTPQNAKAFGQLFYHYDIAGSQKWLNLTYQVYQTFPKQFAMFKERLLDPLHDWSDCLEKSEVDTLIMSMKKLESHPDHQEMLWALIDAHGETVGRMRYAEVWRAYDMVINYVNANQLTFDKKQFIDAIKNYKGQFNATQFLRRLYAVLQHTGNRQDSHDIQQEILANLSRIDWREDGFYYACLHENYRYWDQDLLLNNMQRVDGTTTPSYIATWDNIDLKQITNSTTHTLRYAAQRLKLNKADFDALKTIIKKVPEHNTAIMRLITASIALGSDTLDELKTIDWAALADKRYTSELLQINQLLQLDAKELVGLSYHVRMADLLILLHVLTAEKLQTDLSMINALGRALASFTGDKKTQLSALISYGKQHGFNDPLITAYPWLVNDPIHNPPKNDEVSKFYKQLSSIDFSKSTLPTKDQLTNIINTIKTPDDRRNAVNTLIKQNCFITDQDAEFRATKPDEMEWVDNFYLSKTFETQNRQQLKILFSRLAIKQDGNAHEKIKALFALFTELDRKNYYNELGQLLGLLVEQSQDKYYYSVEQLTGWLETVFDATAFKTKPYPVEFIKALLIDALHDENSSLLNTNLTQLQTQETRLDPLKKIIGDINHSELPDQAKKILVKCAIQFKREENLAHIHTQLNAIFTQLKKSPRVTSLLCDLIATQLNENPTSLLNHIEMLTKLTSPCELPDDELKKLWESNQIKLLDGLNKQIVTADYVSLLVSIANQSIRTILIAATTESDDPNLIKTLQTQLGELRHDDLLTLAKYYTSLPKPSLQELHTLLSLNKKLEAKIDHFERVIQATDPKTNQSKRHYSLDGKDEISIKRVLGGLKLKHQEHGIAETEKSTLLRLLYYMNTHSRVMQFEEKSDAELRQLIQHDRDNDTPEAKARIIACMRELVLRKTGKWVNHTQMIDLLYSALHNDDNLLHQIRMGQGKSIIGLMRVGYRAIHGQSVVVFSSKESLSLRDHQESLTVLESLGIRHGYLTAQSEPEQFDQQVNAEGIGSVRYSIMGNWGLSLEGICWDNKDAKNPINMHANNLVAFIDEGDQIMRNENTLLNFSDQTDAGTLYNFDAWVYQVVSDFYSKNQEKFKTKNLYVSENPDLKNLYAVLQKAAQTIAPEKSSFFQKYLASGNTVQRNQTLVRLLTAAHLARDLKKDVDYCIMADQKKISDSSTIDTRFAKVMIDNQVYHGSTYSDLVQQFLHVYLNEQAIKDNQPPNFFIEPESEIVLSLNASYILKNYFKQIEACTGTAGDKNAVIFYRDEFGIARVIKIPTHQDVKSVILSPIYCDDEDKQMREIIDSIRRNPNQPILITCENDKAVKRLGELLQKSLNQERAIVIDTNAQGLKEEEILKKAGLQGAITISSRLGRGSDIKPYDTEQGLKVIRTYPATPEIVKQEQGRQGRNGAGGECQDIINYSAVNEELRAYSDHPDFKTMLDAEREHLEVKLAKHQMLEEKYSITKAIWREIRQNNDLKEQYLKTRTLQAYKQKLYEENEQRTRQKAALLIEGSAAEMAHARTLSSSEKTAFKDAWKQCRKDIEANWANEPSKSHAALDAFYKKYNIKPAHDERAKVSVTSHHSDKSPETGPAISIAKQLAFHQSWLKSLVGSSLQYGHLDLDLLYGTKGQDLEQLYQAFKTLDEEQLDQLAQIANKYPTICHSITCKAWTDVITILHANQDGSTAYKERLDRFFTQRSESGHRPKTPKDISDLSKQFVTTIDGAPDIEFLNTIIRQHHFAHKDYLFAEVEAFPRNIVNLCKDFMSQEDIVFFLDNLDRNKDNNATVIDYLTDKDHNQQLQANPASIRPLIPLLFKHTALFDKLNHHENTAALLDFLSKRSFTDKDYHELQAKIARIDEKNQAIFLELLSEIPPYISVRDVLNDLRDLPGRFSFEGKNNNLRERIAQIRAATIAFNNFLFTHDIISNKTLFRDPSDDKKHYTDYNTWHTIFSKLPLDNRETLFNTIKEINQVSLDDLNNLAHDYSAHQSNQQLHNDLIQLRNKNKHDRHLTSDKQSSPQTVPHRPGLF